MRRIAPAVLAALLLAGCADRIGPPPERDRPTMPSVPPYVPPTFDAARTAGPGLVIPVENCGRPPLGASVEETAEQVELTLLVDGVRPLPCEQGGLTARLTVRLEAPLGNRRLVDGATGKAVRAFDSSSLLAPPSLPAPFDVGRRDEGGSGQVWQLSWPAGDFAVAARTGEVPAPRTCPAGRPVTVRGGRGTACVETGGTSVTWTERGLRRELSAGWAEASGAGPAPIDLAGLLRIAETLRPLG